MTLVFEPDPYLWIHPLKPAEGGMFLSIGEMGKLRPREV